MTKPDDYRTKFPLTIELRKYLINGKVHIKVQASKETGESCEYTTESKRLSEDLIDELWSIVTGFYEDAMGFPYKNEFERVNKDYDAQYIRNQLPELNNDSL